MQALSFQIYAFLILSIFRYVPKRMPRTSLWLMGLLRASALLAVKVSYLDGLD